MNNKVHEGIAIDDSYTLKFFPMILERDPAAGWGFGCWLEFNESQGRRRPYLSGVIGRLHIQCGWLFDRRESHGKVRTVCACDQKLFGTWGHREACPLYMTDHPDIGKLDRGDLPNDGYRE